MNRHFADTAAAALLLACTPLLAAEPNMSATYADMPQAVLQLEKRLGENPFDALALNNLAVTKARSGELYEALSLLERAARLAPDTLAIQQNRDALEAWLGRRAKAQGGTQTERATPYVPQPAPPPIW